jgi:F-type H+-transporting ATPase subunit epsilon
MLQVELITPAGKVFQGAAIGVQLPGTSGSFEVLTDHAALVSTLEKGPVNIRIENAPAQTYQVAGGVVEVLKNKVTILAEQVLA